MKQYIKYGVFAFVAFCIVFTMTLSAMVITKVAKGTMYTEIIVHDTVYISVPTIVYRDTCDSKFMQAIIECETRNYSKMAMGKYLYPSIGYDNINDHYLGLFQMSEIYFESCDIAHALGYSFEQMMSPEHSFHVFWAKMGVAAYKYKKNFGSLPTREQLVRIHAAGSTAFKRNPNVAQKYVDHFNRVYNGPPVHEW